MLTINEEDKAKIEEIVVDRPITNEAADVVSYGVNIYGALETAPLTFNTGVTLGNVNDFTMDDFARPTIDNGLNDLTVNGIDRYETIERRLIGSVSPDLNTVKKDIDRLFEFVEELRAENKELKDLVKKLNEDMRFLKEV